MSFCLSMFIYFFSSYSEASDHIVLTTLTGFQQAFHVAVVQPEEPVFDSGYWKVRVIDLWTEKKLPFDSFYTLLPDEARGKIFIGTYGGYYPYKTLEERLSILIRTALPNSDDHIKRIKETAGKLNENEKKGIYLHPWYPWNSWPVLNNDSGELYVAGCIDGLTEEPLIDPPLQTVRKLALPQINDPPNISVWGFLYPGGLVDDFNGLRCEATRFDKVIHWIKSLL